MYYITDPSFLKLLQLLQRYTVECYIPSISQVYEVSSQITHYMRPQNVISDIAAETTQIFFVTAGAAPTIKGCLLL